ncbi:protein SCAR2 isoform X2 [Tanacetum coccineum]
MAITRYSIRNVYGLGHGEACKTAADKDADPEALLEAVAMSCLVGLLRQLGDLAQYRANVVKQINSNLSVEILFGYKRCLDVRFAAEIFQDLHEEVMSTAARGHGLLVRVQKLESEIPLIEREFLSQTSNSAFFPNSGIEWHPNRQLAQNLVTAGDLPRFVMDSYEQCRGPPRLFLLDKFDVGGAGACLKRYTDPAVYKVEASTYEIERASKQRDIKIRQTKNKGIGWNGGETPYVTQSSHVNRLHQLFLEERVQNGVTEPVHCVKLKQRSKRSPFDSESGESYMKKILNSPFEDRSVHEALVCSSPLTLPSDTSSKSRIETPENDIVGSFLGSAMQSISPYVSSSLETTICEGSTYKLQKTEIQEVDEERIGAVDEEVKMDGFQNGYPSDEVVSDTDNYMDALATMESELETSSNQGTYSDANKDQLQSQSSGFQSMENTSVSDYENKPIRKRITLSVDFDTTSMSTENASPVAIDSRLRPFASFEIPFRPRDPPVAEKQLVTRHPDNDVTTDTCIDARKESIVSSGFDTALHVDQVEEGQSTETNSDEGSSNHAERFDSPRKVKDRQVNLEVTVECISEHPDFISTVVKGDIENKYPNDTSIPKSPIPNILATNKVEYPDEKLSTGSVDSQWSSSRTDEQRSDIDVVEVEPSETTFSDDDVPVVDETADNLDIYTLPEQESEDMVDGVSRKSGPEEAKVSYPIEDDTEGAKVSEIEMVSGAVSGLLDVKEETELEVRETEVNPVPSPDNVDRNVGKDLGDDTELKGIDADSVNTEMEMSDVVSLPVDVHKKDDNVPSTFGNHSVINHSKEPGEAVEVDQLLIKSTDFDYVPSDTCDDPNNDIDSSSLDSEILHDHSQHFFSQMNEKKVVLHDVGYPSVDSAPCDHSDVQFLDSTSEITVFPEANHQIESASLDDKIYQPNDKIDIFTAVQSSPLEDKVDHPNGQVCAGTSLLLFQLDSQTHLDHKTLFNTHTGPYGVKHTSQPAVEENDQVKSIHLQDLQSSPKTCSVPAFERAPTVESLQASSHDSSLFHHVKHQPAPVKLKSMPPLPPPPPKKWWMKKPPTDGGKHRDNYIPPVSPSKPNVGLKVGGDSILDEIRSLFTKNKNSQNGAGSFSMLSPESKLHTKDHDSLSVSSEGTITQAAVETEYSCSLHTEGHDTQSVSPEAMVLQTEVEKEQSSLPPIVEKLSNNILPMLPSTPIKDPQVVGHSTLDDITGLNAENQKSQHSSGSFSQMSSPVSSLNSDDPNDSYVSPEATVPQAAVETGNFCIITAASDQEAFQPNPSPVDTIISNFPPVFPSTPTDDSQAVGQSKLDEKPQQGVGSFSSLSSPGSNIHTNNHENSPVSSEETVPQAAVETEQSYSLSAIVDEMPTKSTPVFPSTPKEDLHVVAQSTEDVIRYLDTENKKSFSHKASPKSSVHTEKHGKTSVSAKASLAENSMPQTSVPITYGQENLSPSSNRYALQRPRTPLADAVSPNDKYKLKVSDQATNQIPKGEAHDNILDQIRAKSFKLKPAVETRPTSIRGPLTNLRVAAMIEKANAIRQAFAGSDDDSDGWSD